jgi:arylsulfatase A-like enzyme
MHVYTHLAEKWQRMITPQNGWTIEGAGMAQLDDIVGSVMQKVKAIGEDANTIVMFTTDNGTEVFSWPDGGMTPFKGAKGMTTEGSFRSPCIAGPVVFPQARSRTGSWRPSTGSRHS